MSTPPPPKRNTQDPRMPYVHCEVGFVTDASIQGYLVLDDPVRGRLDVGKLAPGGGPHIGGGVYEDVSEYLSAVTTRQGATRVESPLIRYEAGEASITLRNEDRRFDPTNLDGPYVTGSGSATTETVDFVNTRPVPRGWAVTLAVRSHASLGPASLRDIKSATTLGGSMQVDKPTGTASGDYLVAISIADWGTAAAQATPTGGTSWGTPLVAHNYGTNRGTLKVWGKFAGTSEPANYGFTQDSGAYAIAAVIAVRNVAAGSTPVVAWDALANRIALTTPGVTPLTPDDFEIRLVGGVADGGPPSTWEIPAGFTEALNVDLSGWVTAAIGTRILHAIGKGESQVQPMRPVRFMATWGSTTNMVTNPSFEDGMVGWSASGATLAADTTRSIYGRVGARVVKAAGTATRISTSWQAVIATGGDPVTFSAWVFVPSATFSSLTDFTVVGTGEGGAATVAFGNVSKPPHPDRWYRVAATGTVADESDLSGLQIQINGTHASNAVIMYLDGVQVIKGTKPEPFTTNAKRYPLWAGFVDQWDVAWDEGNGPYWSESVVTATDAFKVFENVDRLPSEPQGANENTGDRIHRVLDTVYWPDDLRQIAIGNSLLQETTLEGSVLTELQHVLDSELGEGYMDASGKFVFRNRNALLTEPRSTEPQAVFGDDHRNPQELPWEKLGVSTDDGQLVNKVSVGRAGGEVQVVENLNSQARFLMRTFNREDLLLRTDAEALAYAKWILALSYKPELRFDSMTINVLKDPWRLFPVVLERQIGDMIRIIRRPPGGGAPIIRDVIIRGIQHEIGQVNWRTTWQFQDASKFADVVAF